MNKKIKLNLKDLKVRSMVTLPDEELRAVAGGAETAATERSSVNTKFTDIAECCCSFTQCYSPNCNETAQA